MNETITSIMNRRSCRKFSEQEVPFSELMDIVTAGRFACTGMGIQPWWFTVIRDPKLLKDIEESARESYAADEDERAQKIASDPDFSLFYGAKTVVIVSGTAQSPYTMADCANACQNMTVAAESLGINSCYIASFLRAFENEEKAGGILANLELPQGYIPFFAVALGYKADDCPASPAGGVRLDTVTIIRPKDQKLEVKLETK